VGNIYQGGNSFDEYYFAVEGYDGIPGTGDEAHILSCSFADSSVVHGGWGDGEEWAEARAWHVKAWGMVIQSLKEYYEKPP